MIISTKIIKINHIFIFDGCHSHIKHRTSRYKQNSLPKSYKKKEETNKTRTLESLRISFNPYKIPSLNNTTQSLK